MALPLSPARTTGLLLGASGELALGFSLRTRHDKRSWLELFSALRTSALDES